MKELILIYFRNLKTKKSYIVTLMLIFIFIFALMIIDDYYNYKYDIEIINNLNNRSLVVSDLNPTDENMLEKIKKIEHVEFVKNVTPRIILKDKNEIGYEIEYIDIKVIENLLLNEITELQKYEIIIPNSVKLTNDVLTLHSKNEQYNLNVVGRYISDSKKIYISKTLLEEIMKDAGNDYSDNLLVIFDQYENYNEVINKISDLECSVNFLDSSGLQKIDSYNTIITIIRMVLVIIVFFSIFILYFLIKNSLISESKDLCYMIITGYNNKDIKLYNILKCTIFVLMIYFSVFVLFNLSCLFMLIIFNSNYVKTNYYDIMLLSFISLLVLLLVNYFALFFTRSTITNKNLIAKLKE